jgi:Uma2 family endonuclease
MADPIKKEDKQEQRCTYGDYKTWPRDERWELIEGVPFDMSPAPKRIHQEVSAVIFTKIRQFLCNSPCTAYAAPFDVLLPALGEENEDDVTSVVQPDISVICDKTKLTEAGCTGAPDWIVEIISPYTSKKDFDEKFKLYEKHKVREYWIIDPGNRYIHIYLLGENDRYPEEPCILEGTGTAESAALQGFGIDLEELFRFD